MTLADMRRLHGRQQVEVAALLGASQSRVSYVERVGPLKLEVATLAAYLVELGGTLRLVAVFPDGGEYPLAALGSPPPRR